MKKNFLIAFAVILVVALVAVRILQVPRSPKVTKVVTEAGHTELQDDSTDTLIPAAQPQVTGIRPRAAETGQRPARSRRAPPQGVAAPLSAERLQALEQWEEYIEGYVEREGTVSEAESFQFKARLEKLHADDRLDAIQTALILVPEQHFALFYPVLFDKSSDIDLLDEIFSDVLNQEDEIKMPILLAIYQDKTHPMQEEAERILDAIGELDVDGEVADDGEE